MNSLNNVHYVFTSVNANYLPQASVLARSIKQNSIEIKFVVFLVEPRMPNWKPSLDFDKSSQLFADIDEIITLSSFSNDFIDNLREKSVVDACTAIKGAAALLLLNRDDSEYITYIDPDIYVFSNLNPIYREHEFSEVLLTPHLLESPLNVKGIWNDEIAGSMMHGLFNLGFISFKKSELALTVAGWWADRLKIFCAEDYSRGLYTDQKWFDVATVYFPGIRIVRDPTWNVGPWNFLERSLAKKLFEKDGSRAEIFFFHASKFNSIAFAQKMEIAKPDVGAKLFIEMYRTQLQEAKDRFKNVIAEADGMRKRDTEIGASNELIAKRAEPNISFQEKFRLGIISTQNHIKRRAVNNQKLVSYIIKRPKLFRFLKQLLGNLERNTLQVTNLPKEFSKELIFDCLIVTHYGGGGVEICVQESFQQKKKALLSVAILRPKIGGGYLLQHSGGTHFLEDQEVVQRVVLQAAEIEFHHLRGLDILLDLDYSQKNNKVYLHDRFLMSTRPFHDAVPYIRERSAIPGVDIPLNGDSLSDQEWRRKVSPFLRNQNYFFAPSNYIRDQFLRYYPDLIINVVSLDADIAFVDKVRYVGRFDKLIVISPTGPHKGSDFIAQVADELDKRNSDLRIVIHGDLPLADASILGSKNNVLIVPEIDRERLRLKLRGSSDALAWIPSLTGESYSLALSDFLATGFTILATNAGAIPERLQGRGKNYLYERSCTVEHFVTDLLNLQDNLTSDFIYFQSSEI